MTTSRSAWRYSLCVGAQILTRESLKASFGDAFKPSMIGVIAPGLSIHNLVGMPDVDMEDHCCIQSEELWPRLKEQINWHVHRHSALFNCTVQSIEAERM
ncbi:hypothetical protein SADUNF_Sadunf09G0076000 [Salix dunnii]|uniref:Uncharacterized protein n=1 Tax=Salix dunnii TaxID=1413687 RepID=A0A835JVM7_9ROSI|nr:hypothetical protein SADUNF_Sadunf09G0076000 [Salix dunnii]